MKTQANKTPYLPLLVSGIAVILFSSAGFARMMGWGLTSTGDFSDSPALDQAAPVPTVSAARARTRCAECGVIVSMRAIERPDEDTGPGATGEATAEITIRMADGSSRVIVQANPARWRTGESLIVIAGTNPPPP